jgi:tetratricopeptide (TPR) repeat protein
MLRTVCSITFALMLTGCVTAINQHNADRHEVAGNAFYNQGDWVSARRQYAQAVVNSDLGRASANDKARVNYSYGRVLGIMCAYDKAEQYLRRSRELAGSGATSTYLSLYELGQISQAQGKSQEAARYFAELIPLLDQMGLRSKFPLGVADAHDRYATALEASGNREAAAAQRAEAAAIRSDYPGAVQAGAATPYGTACPAAVGTA